jgi:glycosyltransferase involved in cell wall biosynthesis
VFVDVRLNLERLGPMLPPGCLKVLHAETAHHAVHNAAQQRRLDELAARRGIRLPPYKMIAPNEAVEHADEVTVLGNAFTMSTYAFAGKPMHRIPISCPYTYPAPEGKDFAPVARRFVWFGSDGFMHKGLDLVLEAFAGLPAYELTVCGPIHREPQFQRAFYRELYRTSNICTVGWVDVGGDEFRSICDRSAALLYPTCSEGGGGSVINCMHAGLIPMIPEEASVDFDAECGVLLEDMSVEGLQAAVREFAARPPGALRSMALAAHDRVNRRHTRETFSDAYRAVVHGWLDRRARAADSPGGER